MVQWCLTVVILIEYFGAFLNQQLGDASSNWISGCVVQRNLTARVWSVHQDAVLVQEELDEIDNTVCELAVCGKMQWCAAQEVPLVEDLAFRVGGDMLYQNSHSIAPKYFEFRVLCVPHWRCEYCVVKDILLPSPSAWKGRHVEQVYIVSWEELGDFSLNRLPVEGLRRRYDVLQDLGSIVWHGDPLGDSGSQRMFGLDIL